MRFIEKTPQEAWENMRINYRNGEELDDEDVAIFLEDVAIFLLEDVDTVLTEEEITQKIIDSGREWIEDVLFFEEEEEMK